MYPLNGKSHNCSTNGRGPKTKTKSPDKRKYKFIIYCCLYITMIYIF